MGNILKGILYTGLAGAIGAGGYLIGKYKHMKGVSLTMVGLALVLYAPKGCDVMETYVKTRGEVEKAKIYGTARKDSIDAIVNSKKSRDSTLYLKQFLHNVTATSKQLETTYKSIISENEKRYQQLLQKNDAQYDKVLTGIIEENDVLKKNLENMRTSISDQYTAVSPTDGTLVNVKTVNNKRIEDRVLSDGKRTVVEYVDKRTSK